MKPNTVLKLHFAVAVAVLAAAVGLLAYAVAHQVPKPVFQSIDIGNAGYPDEFAFDDPDGRQRTLADFRGKVVLLFFGFTQCPAACPTELARSAEVLRLLGPDAKRVQMVFVTVDPERDTPQLLRAYVRAFDPSFLGLRGDIATTTQTAHRFHAYFTKVPTGDSYTMDHTTITYAFDPSGHARLAVRPEQDAASVAADIRQLLAT